MKIDKKNGKKTRKNVRGWKSMNRAVCGRSVIEI
jgi:hypothetical protein